MKHDVVYFVTPALSAWTSLVLYGSWPWSCARKGWDDEAWALIGQQHLLFKTAPCSPMPLLAYLPGTPADYKMPDLSQPYARIRVRTWVAEEWSDKPRRRCWFCTADE